MGWVQRCLFSNLQPWSTFISLNLILILSACEGHPQLWEWGRLGKNENEGSVGNQPGQWGHGIGGGDAPDPSIGWDPNRKAKSLAFLSNQAIPSKYDDNRIDSDNNANESDEDVTDKPPKKAKLNVSDKDSPYALIDKYFPERESYFYQNKDKFLSEYRDQQAKKTDIGNLNPSEVWLADSSLLVLKGGSTPDRDGYDDPWEPLDDFQAPYKEPVLPPPDFDPDSLDIGVGIPIEEIVKRNQKNRRNFIENEDKNNYNSYKFVNPFKISNNFDLITRDELLSDDEFNSFSLETPEITLKPYRDEIVKSQQEFHDFLNDVSQFISEMENFHSERKGRQQQANMVLTTENPIKTNNIHLTNTQKGLSKFVDENIILKRKDKIKTPEKITKREKDKIWFKNFPRKTTKSPSTTTKSSFSYSKSLPTLVPPYIASKTKTFNTSSLFPLSYSSPFSKVYLSTPYTGNYSPPVVNNRKITTIDYKSTSQQYHTRARSTKTTIQTTTNSIEKYQYTRTSTVTTLRPLQIQSFTFLPNINRKKTTTLFYKYNEHTTFKSPPFPNIFNHNNYITQPFPIITPRYSTKTTSVTFTSTVSTPSYQYRDTGDWQPVTAPELSQFYTSEPFDENHVNNNGPYNFAPTPYSLFQSVPENINARDVFHLSQNVDFGKKLDESSGHGLPNPILNNEIDTGGYTPFQPIVSPHKLSTVAPPYTNKYRVHRARRLPASPPLYDHKQRRPLSHGPRKGRVRNTVRRRRPKQIMERGNHNVDRQGTGDVRYVSFYSGVAGGKEWGYSYNLGR